jgi:membrane-associated phospholipid phosphatase
MKLKSTYLLAFALAALALTINPAAADVVTDWNQITVAATKTGGLNSNLGTRIDAIEAIAVYDAVNSINRSGTPYHYFSPPASPALAEAAAAQAAHDVLVNYFPAQATALNSNLSHTLSFIPDGPAKDNGRAAGSASAADIIALRANDGSSPNVNYPGPANSGVGQWRPTPSGFAQGINEQWGSVTPFVLPSGSVFRPGPAPAVGSWKYNQALAEVAAVGSVSNSARTVDQTHIAQFYKQDAELPVNEAARILSDRHGLSLAENALLFVLTDIAAADARIAVWDAKYTYLFWRPVTALNANADGSVTNGYAGWLPSIATPAHPSYPSGHSGTVDAGFTVLQLFFGDQQTLTLSTTTAGEPPRTINRLSQFESENGLSRIYGGIHYSFDNEQGQLIGVKVAAYVLTHGPQPAKRGSHDKLDGDRHDLGQESNN